MEKTKQCLACGQEMPFDQDQCPLCQLAGQNQLFLSQAAYEEWEKTVLRPHKAALRPPRVFAGWDDRFMVLLGNGDLYAQGNNFAEAFGPDAPRKMEKLTLIAEHVKDAAMCLYHTLYVTEEGEVKLLGNSRFTERFRCDLKAQRVFGGMDYGCLFWIVDEQGQTYWLGDKENYDREGTVLDYSPKITVSSVISEGFWGSHDSPQGFQSHYERSHTDDDLKKEVRRTVERFAWYRELLTRYGENNIHIAVGESVYSTLRSQWSQGEINWKTYDHVYHPKILLKKREVYTPERTEQPLPWQEKCFFNGHPMKGEVWGWRKPAHVVKSYFFRDSQFIYLDDRGRLHYRNRQGKDVIALLAPVADFSVKIDYHEMNLALSTQDGTVYQGVLRNPPNEGSWGKLKKVDFCDKEAEK